MPIGELSGLQEDGDRFYVTAVLDKGNEHVKLAIVEWKKQPFDVWCKGREPLTRPWATLSPKWERRGQKL